MNPLRLNMKKYSFLSTPAAPLASTVRVCSVTVHRLLNVRTGPLTTFARRFLTIKNNNSQPIAFKILTTAPKVRLRFKQLIGLG
jgi:hypothetical protein